MLISMAYELSVLLSILGVVVSVRFRKLPGSYPFLALSLLAGIASFASHMEHAAMGLEAKMMWRAMQQIGLLYTPVAMFLLAASYSMYEKHLTLRLVLAISFVPTVGLLLIYTNEHHGWMGSLPRLSEKGHLVIAMTSLHAFCLVYGFVLSMIAIGLLLKSYMFTRGIQHKQLLVLILGLSIHSLVSVLKVFDVFPVSGDADSIALSYLLSELLFLWGVYRYQLLEVIPIARNKVFDVMKEGIVILDADARVLDMNAAAHVMLGRMIGKPMGRLTGNRIDRMFPSLSLWIAAHHSGEERELELAFHEEGKACFHLSFNVVPVIHGTDTFVGSISVLTDITEIKQKEEELQRKAVTDGLTGIYNRNGFIDAFRNHLAQTVSSRRPLVLLVMDIDYFKSINDRYGHQTGDEAIQAFVNAVLPLLHKDDVFGRIGGEEFALALTGAAENEAYMLAESIRKAVERIGILTPEGGTVGFTVSVGMTVRTPEERSFEQMYSKADRSLYAAKQAGRNRTVVSGVGLKS